MKTFKSNIIKNTLSTHQQWYWKDPEHARELQRAKYKKYPEKIYAINRAWQQKNKEHWKMLVKFANLIHQAKVSGNGSREKLLRAARETYKKTRKGLSK